MFQMKPSSNTLKPQSGSRLSRFADRLGISLVVICLIHCTILPLLLIISPLLFGTFVSERSFHVVMMTLVLPTAVIAFALAWRRHRRLGVLLAGGIGVLIIAFAALAGHNLVTPSGEKILTSIGGVFLAGAHLLNLRS